MKKEQNVVIKGIKDGLTLYLDDQCSYEELKKELEERLLEKFQADTEHHLIQVKVQIGNRYLSDEQIEELKQLVRKTKNLIVDTIESNVISKTEAARIKAENEIVSVTRIVRSGQVLEVPGDLLLIGDVNPGGKVIAGGNIFILGSLKGIAHAGVRGNREAVITATIMKPTQLRINNCLNRAPDDIRTDTNREMECAYIDIHNQIVIDRLQVLIHLRPNLTRLEGGH